MSVNIATFELEVIVQKGPSQYKPICYYGKAEWMREKITKMFHVIARTQEQAIAIVRKKYGEPISCRKVDASSYLASIEHIKLEEQIIYGVGNSCKGAIVMDEMVWNKRNKRRDNMFKDKRGT